MLKIRLEARQGEFVSDVHIPPFQLHLLPEVVMWGIRHFMLWNKDAATCGQQPIYREVFCCAVLDNLEATNGT